MQSAGGEFLPTLSQTCSYVCAEVEKAENAKLYGLQINMF